MRTQKSELLKVLTDVGLTDNQAQVYLASLSLGPALPVEIARRAEIKRTTVYSVIESLQNLGVINVELRGFKKYYFAEQPEKLESIVDQRHKELSRSLGKLSALSGLKSSDSILRYYEGKESVKSVFNDLLQIVKPGDEYMVISNHRAWYELDPEFAEDFTKRRAKLGVNIRCILWDPDFGENYVEKAEQYNLKVKFLASDSSFSGNLVIVPQRVWLSHSLQPVWGTTIEHPHIIKFFQEMFESWWDSLD